MIVQQSHDSIVDNNFDGISLTSSFLSRNKAFDNAIKREKKRILRMKRKHMLCDVILSTFLVAVCAYLVVQTWITHNDPNFYLNVTNAVHFGTGILTMGLLACSAA